MEISTNKISLIATFLIALVALVLVVACGGGSSNSAPTVPENDVETPATNLDEDNLDDNTDDPTANIFDIEIDWHQSETLPNRVSLSYATFGKPGSLLINEDGNAIMETIDEITGTSRPEYSVAFLDNNDQPTLLDWFGSRIDKSGSIIASGNYTTGITNNGVEYLNITGSIPSDHIGPLPDLYALSPDGKLIIVIQTMQESPTMAVSSQSARDKVYLTILESMTFQ